MTDSDNFPGYNRAYFGGDAQNSNSNYPQNFPTGNFNQNYYNNAQVKPNNYIIPIIFTLFCCNILAVVAMYYASRVDVYYENGNYAAAKNASNKARNYMLIGIGIGVIFMLASYFLKANINNFAELSTNTTQ